MPPVKVCARCGHDVPIGHRCGVCEPHARRARRHPGYDDAVYRAYRRAKVNARAICERCGVRPGAILHHNDGDPATNTRDGSNYTWACVVCAEHLDAAMRAARNASKPGPPRRGRSPWQ